MNELLKTALTEEDFRFTVLHKLTHFRRWYMLYKRLVQLTICLHWFNPLVWLMGREISRACELACDEAVIRELDEAGRLAYGDTLVRTMEAGGKYGNSLASATLTENAELRWSIWANIIWTTGTTSGTTCPQRRGTACRLAL